MARCAGEAVNGDEAMRLAAGASPGVVIPDSALEHEGGSVLWLCGALRLAVTEPPRILLCCGTENVPEDFEDAEEYLEVSGAEGFVEAGEDGEVLLDPIRRVHAGERVRRGI